MIVLNLPVDLHASCIPSIPRLISLAHRPGGLGKVLMDHREVPPGAGEHARNPAGHDESLDFYHHLTEAKPRKRKDEPREQHVYVCQTCGTAKARFVPRILASRQVLSHRPHPLSLPSSIVTEKAYTRSSNLLRHSRIHMNERRFTCSTCGKRFQERHHLAAHE